MKKIENVGVTNYQQKNGLAPKDINVDMISTLVDKAPALSTV